MHYFWSGLALLLLALFLFSPPVSGQIPDGGWQVSQDRLDNGLTVLLLEDHRAPVVTLQVWYKVGSRNEQLGLTGISHLLEHLMFRGTPKYGEGEFSRLIKEHGGILNAFTSTDHTVYFERISTPHLDLILELEADRMANLNLNQTDLEAERQIVMEERRLRTTDDPASALWEQVSATAYTAHPYAWPIIGWQRDLESISLAQVKRHRQTYYTPGNAILIIAGDISRQTVLPKIKATFGTIPAGPPAPPVTALEPPQRGERRVTFKRPAALPLYIAAYQVPNIRGQDSPALSVLAVILGSGQSARLQKTLVEEHGLVLSANAGYNETAQDAPLFTLSMRIAPGKTWQAAETALFDQIEQLKTQAVTDRELERAKNLLESHFIYGQDSLFYRAMQLGQYASLGDWQLVQRVVPNLRAVTSSEVQLATQTYLREDNRTVGVLIPEGQPIHERPSGSLGGRIVH